MIVALIIIAAFVTAALAIIQHLNAEQEKKEAEIKEVSLNNKIDSLLHNNHSLTGKIADLAELNANLSKQLKETSVTLNENTIGGSLLRPNGYLINENSFQFQFINKDKLPIYDLFISVIDLDLARKGGVVNENQKIVRFSSKNIANYIDQKSSQLNVGFSTTMNKIYFIKDGETKNFTVSIGCRKNRQIMQVIVFKKGGKITEIHRTYLIVDDNWKLIEEEGRAEEYYWKEMFFGNRDIGYDSTK